MIIIMNNLHLSINTCLHPSITTYTHTFQYDTHDMFKMFIHHRLIMMSLSCMQHTHTSSREIKISPNRRDKHAMYKMCIL